ncbi:anthranilate phosphoribosyltransferase [Dactylosporangium sp. NPDC051485]|uniref:anthranilate phosphoribosyltransferase n=1 Tax=Dactylosporangium sp. NPDC051485 TaxID=3154846 RepID=UPI0034399C4E
MLATIESWPALLARLLAGRDLTEGEAAWLMDEVIRGDASPVRLAAMLVALRAKGETAAELGGFVAALLRAATPVPVPGPTLDLAGTGGDGTNAVNLSTMAAIVAAAAGARVVKHGGRAASATSAGSADVVERLGVPLDLTPSAHAAVAVAAGITFVFAAHAHPGMRHASPVRRELGVPTVFNLLGPLINPAGPTHRLVGVADGGKVPLVAEVLRARGASGLVVRGDDGLDKLSTATTSQVWEVREGTIARTVLDPAALGIPAPAPGALRGGDAAANARVVHEVLAGRPGAVRDAVLLNAAAGLVAADPGDDGPFVDRLKTRYARCAEAIDSGAAAATLTHWAKSARARA